MPIPYIIPLYKNPLQLEKCVAAIQKQTVPVTPWIWDNNVQNIYYTKAQNQGLRAAFKAGERFAYVGTQDCYLHPDATERFIDLMNANPRCAIAGPKQLLASDPDVIIHGGGTIAYPAGHHRHGRVSNGDCARNDRVPWVNGACMFVRLEAIQGIGMMDENMLMLGSDSDWCFTARARQWEVWYCAQAVCLHEAGVSSKPSSGVLNQIFVNDMGYFRDKWIGTTLYARLASEFDRPPMLSAANVMMLQ